MGSESRRLPPELVFTLLPVKSKGTYYPRLGLLQVQRQDGSNLSLDTPCQFTSTHRGLVPHLSRDHVKRCLTSYSCNALSTVHVPLESFLDHNPPIPTLYPSPTPLHDYLGYDRQKHLLHLSLRDPNDLRPMPPNSGASMGAVCLRGVRKVTPLEYLSYAKATVPDIVTALADTPLPTTNAAGPSGRTQRKANLKAEITEREAQKPGWNINASQKRLTKSVERTVAWLHDLLFPLIQLDGSYKRLNVVVVLAGMLSIQARQSFSQSLVEKLHQQSELDAVAPFQSLDECLAGYVAELAPLRVPAAQQKDVPLLTDLLQASFRPLPPEKPRFVHSASDPHEILLLIQKVGIDLFDSSWAVDCADKGLALDFTFPVRSMAIGAFLGHNLYLEQYSQQFVKVADAFQAGAEAASVDDKYVCWCPTCSPIISANIINHSQVDVHSHQSDATQRYTAPHTRAFLHHLLLTHEMSAHSMLVMHNLAVADRFFEGIRDELRHRPETFDNEVQTFSAVYAPLSSLLHEAIVMWAQVERERGKGRLKREKESQILAQEGAEATADTQEVDIT